VVKINFNQIGRVASAGITASVLGVGILAGSNNANAQSFTVALFNTYSCSDAVYGSNGTYFLGAGVAVGQNGYDSRDQYSTACETSNTTNAAGSVVTATQTLRAATAQTVSLISSRISAVQSASLINDNGLSLTKLNLANDLSSGEVGLAGGNTSNGVGLWMQGQFTNTEVDSVASAFDGDIVTVMGGVDKKVRGGKVLFGLAAGFESMDIDTTFNTGTVKSDGFIISPYISLRLGKGFSLDGAVGYASLDYDTTRTDPTNLEIFSGSTNADRYFGSAIMKFDRARRKAKGTWVYGLKAGASLTAEHKDAFTETGANLVNTALVNAQRTHLAQGLFGVSTGFDFGKVEPYVNLTGEFDFAKTDNITVGASQTTPADSDIGLNIGGGINFRFSPKFTGTLSGETILLRDEYEQYSGTARVRYEF
jgi:hypothetical protein